MKFSPAVVNALPYTEDALQKAAANPVAPTEKESSTTEQLKGGFDLNVGALNLALKQVESLAIHQMIASGDSQDCRYVLQYLLENRKIDERRRFAEQQAHEATKLEYDTLKSLKDSLERQLVEEKALREKEAAEHQALLNSDELEVGDDEKAEE